MFVVNKLQMSNKAILMYLSVIIRCFLDLLQIFHFYHLVKDAQQYYKVYRMALQEQQPSRARWARTSIGKLLQGIDCCDAETKCGKTKTRYHQSIIVVSAFRYHSNVLSPSACTGNYSQLLMKNEAVQESKIDKVTEKRRAAAAGCAQNIALAI